MFGTSFSEILVIAAIALLVVGPQKLPAMLGTIGKWAGKVRRISTEMRHQTGIDELLRKEGVSGGLNELRGLIRGQGGFAAPAPRRAPNAPAPRENVEFDSSREYPVEGPDSFGAIADDLLDTDDDTDSETTVTAVEAAASPGSEPIKDSPAPSPDVRDPYVDDTTHE